jgi:hypothetical protein
VKPVMVVKQQQKESVGRAVSVRRSRHIPVLRFQAAFLDFGTQAIYPSRFANGSLAPYHVLDGLPAHLVVDRAVDGRVVAAKASLITGFVRNGFFYTRRAAARAVAQWGGPAEYPR